MVSDLSPVFRPGPWDHRTVAANGSRFHLAQMGDPRAPLVLMLHDTFQFWWAWRHLLEPLAHAGFHAVAMDLRGAGASDKSPRAMSLPRLARDVSGVTASLGHERAVVVGSGTGAGVAWTVPAIARPRGVVGVAGLHPSAAWRAATARQRGFVLAAQANWFAERGITRGDVVERYLRTNAAVPVFDDETVELYREVARIPFAEQCAMARLRWEVRSRVRSDGRRYARRLAAAPHVPSLTILGGADPLLRADRVPAETPHAEPGPRSPDAAAREGESETRGAGRAVVLDGVGHFPAEEAPERVLAELLGFLRELDT